MVARPIFNQAAEEDLIAGILDSDGDHFAFLPEDLAGKDFNLARLGWVFDAARDLWRDGKRPGIATLSNELKRRGQLDDIGGSAGLVKLLPAGGRYIGGLDVAEFGQIVRDCSLKRKNENLLLEVLELNRNGHDASEIVQYLEIGVKALKSTQPAGKKRFNAMSLTELFQQPPKQWLWKNLIGAGDIAMIFGEAGTGKTFATVDLIVSGALGSPFASQFEPVRALGIAYCAGEGLSGIRGRFMAALNSRGITTESVNIKTFTTVPQLFDENSADSTEQFIRELSDLADELDVVFIDTLHSATAGADENHARDAGIILQNAKLISESLAVTVVLIHHANKAGGYRGSSALHGAMDTMIQTRQEGEIFTLECFKQKDAERFRKLFFRLTPDHYSESARVEWLEAETCDLNKEVNAVDLARTQIPEIITRAGRALSQTEIVMRTNVGRNKTIAALEEMEASGALKVKTAGRSKLYENPE